LTDIWYSEPRMVGSISNDELFSAHDKAKIQ